MAKQPSSGRVTLAGRLPRAIRVALFSVIAAGGGYVFHLGATLGYLTFEKPESAPTASSRMPGGALVICGGGLLPENVRGRFLELAGGTAAKIVVIPTANGFADGPPVSPPPVSTTPGNAGDDGQARPRPTAGRYSINMTLDMWRPYRLASLQLLHARSRQEADDATFVKPLAEATGVWISGGTQQRLIDRYRGTEVERQLKALLERGGVIGGTSAGAAVMSGVMIQGGRTEAQVGEGFDFLPGTVIDQHFLRRNRLKRLLGVVKLHPDLIGLGIEESTALVVDVRAMKVHVVGTSNSYVLACVPETVPATAEGGAGPNSSDEAPKTVNVRFEVLKAGDEADLTGLRSLSNNAVIQGIDFDAL
jgi:cyanophycinase